MRVLNIAARACLRSNAPVLIVFSPRLLFSLFAYQHPVNLPFRSQKVTDKLLPATTADELVAHIGMTLGEAKELKLAASSVALLSSVGGGAAVAVATGSVGSMSLSYPQPLVASAVSAALCSSAPCHSTCVLTLIFAFAAAFCRQRPLSRNLQLQAAVRSH